ncbi:helix-turn-helix transcriptional regulator [Spirosoma koreense]
MTINDKIKQILIDKNLTPSYFADEIGVQRSSISHILSGRNRPSFDIIQKIIRRFPDLGYEWIMEEETSNPSSHTGYANRVGHPLSRSSSNRYNSVESSSMPYPNSTPNGIRSQRNEIPPVAPAPVNPIEQVLASANPMVVVPATTNATDKKVERILIFYTDGSFREYTPTAG